MDRPYTLIAELTYRCPLHCAYCSNPTDLAAQGEEMSTAEWSRVIEEAEALGVVQLHLTGGEPAARKDLEPLVRRARELDLYVNLITSGVLLTRDRVSALKDAGLDNVQLSVQGVDAEEADRAAGYRCFGHKLDVARWVKDLGLPLTINLVLHRDNLGRVREAVALAERLGADRLELANAQYQGWALLNRDALLPTRAQLDEARAVAGEMRTRFERRMEIVYVTPDHYADRPRACMDGWARRFIHVTPDGTVLPCHAARSIRGLVFDSARAASLETIWTTSPALARFRGDGWMPQTCRSCSRKDVDFGGCRCQAFAVTGDAANMDPACALSTHHGFILAARERAGHEETPRRFLSRGERIGRSDSTDR